MIAIDLGRYVVCDEIASGGMASVHFGRMLGPAGFGRTVAIKRLHPHFAKDADFVSMMLDEARVASRIHHPNVVAPLDVVHTKSDLYLVMEYVPGETLETLRKTCTERGVTIPRPVALAVAVNVLLGLHAAHEATAEDGRALGIIHRDVSPHNVLVGTDGNARVLDFGIARAAGASHHSDAGQVKGKIAYMSPEQLRLDPDLGREADIYAASMVVWEMLTGKRMFEGANREQIAFFVASGAVRSPRTFDAEISEELEDIVMRGLEQTPARRYPTAKEMAEALEASGRVATPREVAAWIAEIAADTIKERADVVARIEFETLSRIDVRAFATELAEGRKMDRPMAADATIVTAVPFAPTRANGVAPPEWQRHRLAIAGGFVLLTAALWLAMKQKTTPPDASLPYAMISASAVVTTPLAPPPIDIAPSPGVSSSPPASSPSAEPAPARVTRRTPVPPSRAVPIKSAAPPPPARPNDLFDRN